MNERQPIILHLQSKDKPVGILISGTRYSGKDTVAASLSSELSERQIHHTIRSTALELKRKFCRIRNLDEDAFLNDREYKERHRSEFSAWVQTQSQEDNLRSFLQTIRNDFLLMQAVIISDLRNLKDFNEFSFVFPAFVSLRINASEESRNQRGYVSSAYDQTEFETEIQDIPIDVLFQNDGSLEDVTVFSQTFGAALDLALKQNSDE